VDLPTREVSHGNLFEVSLTISLYCRVGIKLMEDVKLLLLKSAGAYAEAFDVIATIWIHIQNYYDSLHFILEVMNALYICGCV
jgi:hypothetical protein